VPTPHVAGVATLPNGEYDAPERDLALRVALDALEAADCLPGALDGIYMPKPRPWTAQGLFSTLLTNLLGARPRRTVEAYTGGTSGGTAFRTAVADLRAGRAERALVLAVERTSTVETADYFGYVLSLFDREFAAPAGPSIPAVYAASARRYCHDRDVDRSTLAEVVVKNRANGAANPRGLFEESVTVEGVLDARPIAEPLGLYECPAPCDGAAALVLAADGDPPDGAVTVAGVGGRHAASHLLGPRDGPLYALPAVEGAVDAALTDAGIDAAADLDLLEPYAPFPHVEAALTEAVGLFDRGAGAAACARGATATDGAHPVSPSGGCLGRGHPAMVTPLLNYAAAVRQLRGTAPAPLQVPGARTALTTTEHGHVDGATAAVFRRGSA
jgi:acetyl-CoA acetyltransferase